MTVRELILKLQECDQESEVTFEYDGEEVPVEFAIPSTYAPLSDCPECRHTMPCVSLS